MMGTADRRVFLRYLKVKKGNLTVLCFFFFYLHGTFVVVQAGARQDHRAGISCMMLSQASLANVLENSLLSGRTQIDYPSFGDMRPIPRSSWQMRGLAQCFAWVFAR